MVKVKNVPVTNHYLFIKYFGVETLCFSAGRNTVLVCKATAFFLKKTLDKINKL